MKTTLTHSPIIISDNTQKKSKKHKKKFKVMKLMNVSLIGIISGLSFGIGYTIIDHADNALFPTKDSAPSAKVAAADSDN